MKYAKDILNNKEIKRQEEMKKHNERVNEELWEIEKALNTYESNLEDDKLYVTVPMIIKTQESKDALKEHGYIIDTVSNDIEVNTTRIWLDEESFRKATTKVKVQDESMLRAEKEVNETWKNLIQNLRAKGYDVLY